MRTLDFGRPSHRNIRSLQRRSIMTTVAMTGLAVVLSACSSSSSSQSSSRSPVGTIREQQSAGPSDRLPDTRQGDVISDAPVETSAAAASDDEELAAAAPETVVTPSAGAYRPTQKGGSTSERTPAEPGQSTSAGGWFEEQSPPQTNPNPSIQSKDPGVNPTQVARLDPLSTFALDVDTSSYTLARALVQGGTLPDYSSVRTEEFVNYFDQAYRSPKSGDTFAIHVDGTSAPFLASNQRIIRVGVQAERVDKADRPTAHLTFVIDTSGSMEEDGKLELVKQSLRTMVNNLRADDEVAIVSFSDEAEVVLGATPAKQRETIIAAIDRLTPTNSTNAEAGLLLGYGLADQMRSNDRAISSDGGSIHRVVLASDGVANVGPNGPDEILRRIKESTTKGIELITIGVGTSSYNDDMMERLADGGDGFSAYVDSAVESDRLFRDRLVSTLQTVARDAKVQVEFNPQYVESYRLLGFENRAVADGDFRNDSVDAGEIGAGHSVTALYEVTLTSDSDDRNIGSVRLRWDDVRAAKIKETSTEIRTGKFSARLSDADPRLGLDVTVAAYAEVLRQGPWARLTNLRDIASQTAYLDRQLGGDPDVVEFIQLLKQAASL